MNEPPASTVLAKPGWKTTEHWLTWAVVLIGIGVIATSSLWWGRIAVLPCISASVAVYAYCRKEIKVAAIATTLIKKAGVPIMAENAITNLVTSALQWVSDNASSLDGYVADVVAKGLRAKHPNSLPAMEADVQNAVAVITATAQGVIKSVTAVRAIVADIQ